MPYCTISVDVKVDSAELPSFPIIRRVFLTEAQVLNIQKAGGDTVGVYTTIPTITEAPALNALILSTDQPLNYRLNSVTLADGVLNMKAGGLLVMVDCNLAAGATSNATVNNVGTNAATISGFAGGT